MQIRDLIWRAPTGPSDGGSSRGGHSYGGSRLDPQTAGPDLAITRQAPVGPGDGSVLPGPQMASSGQALTRQRLPGPKTASLRAAEKGEWGSGYSPT